jgi:hypothetical protein
MSAHRWFMTSSMLGLVVFLFFPTRVWSAQIRMWTYNFQFLSTEVIKQGDRLSKLREVIALLDAHVIGLQEIADRATLEQLFSPTEWHLLIDDDSTDVQDLAVAIRKPLRVVRLPLI